LVYIFLVGQFFSKIRICECVGVYFLLSRYLPTFTLVTAKVVVFVTQNIEIGASDANNLLLLNYRHVIRVKVLYHSILSKAMMLMLLQLEQVNSAVYLLVVHDKSVINSITNNNGHKYL
jgi:hypothetical protein